MRWGRKSAWQVCSGRRGKTSASSIPATLPHGTTFSILRGLLRTLRKSVRRYRLGDGAARSRSSWTSRPGASSGTWRTLIRGFKGPPGGDRPPRQPGRPRGHSSSRTRPAEATGTLVVRAMKAPGGHVHQRGGHRAADRDRDGHRLVPSPEYQARARSAPWPISSRRVPRSTRSISELFERNSLGRLRLMGETLTGLKTDADGRIAYATVTRADVEAHRRDPSRHRRPDRFHRQPQRGRGRTALLRAASRRHQVESPLAPGTGLLAPSWPDFFGGGGHQRSGAVPPCPIRWPKASNVSWRPSSSL